VVLFIQLSLSISPVLSQDIKIGTQVWTSKNLNVSTFRNGESIPEAKSKEEWAKAGENQTAAFCYYEYDRENGEVLGKLYNWYAVNDSRGLAPNGYHIPSDAEWTILTDFLGGKPIAGEKMKSITGWYKSDKDEWNNKRGFNALLGGENIDGDFYNITDYGYWWSSSELLTYYAWSRNLYDNNTKVGRDSNFKDKGFSVRCLRD
jgi:uncharacterized protein (TIGR02145 family)